MVLQDLVTANHKSRHNQAETQKEQESSAGILQEVLLLIMKSLVHTASKDQFAEIGSSEML